MSSPNINLEQLQKITKLDKNEITPVLDKNWILSFSGGADSIMALHIMLVLHKVRPFPSRTLVVYFLDHGDQIQSDSSQRMFIINENLEYIRTKFPDVKLELISRFRDMKQIAHKLKQNFELCSSRIRRKQIDIIYRNHPDSVVITGHSMSDWMETLIMRMNRGAGIEKLYPFLPRENIQSIPYFRPLSLLTSSEIREYCRVNGLIYWNDPSNFDKRNKRSQLRLSGTNGFIYNADGFRLTARNFFVLKKEYLHKQNIFFDNILTHLVSISPGREYRIKFDYFEGLEHEDKNLVIETVANNLKLWPISARLKSSMLSLPFYYKIFSFEKENWHNVIYIIFRRGRNKLHFITESQTFSGLTWLPADKATKKCFIKLTYGHKSVKKILSELKLSKRQKNNLPLYTNINDPYEIVYIPLSRFGLKDVFSIDYLK